VVLISPDIEYAKVKGSTPLLIISFLSVGADERKHCFVMSVVRSHCSKFLWMERWWFLMTHPVPTIILLVIWYRSSILRSCQQRGGPRSSSFDGYFNELSLLCPNIHWSFYPDRSRQLPSILTPQNSYIFNKDMYMAERQKPHLLARLTRANKEFKSSL
jgi:hypothetical protein